MSRHRVLRPWPNYITKAARAQIGEPARSLPKIVACAAQTKPAAGSEQGLTRVSFAGTHTSGIKDLPDQSFQGNFPALGQPIDELALAEIKGAILAKLRLAIGKDTGMATRHDWYKAAALALRDRIVHH